jgi:hypothetical protein
VVLREVIVVPKPLPAIDVSDVPELRRLAEEVQRTGQARVLRRDGEDLAIIRPVPSAKKQEGRRVKTKEDWEAFMSSFGSWKDFDLDQFLRDIEASRRIPSRPIVLD